MDDSNPRDDGPAPERKGSSDARELPPVLRELVEHLFDPSLQAGDTPHRTVDGMIIRGG